MAIYPDLSIQQILVRLGSGNISAAQAGKMLEDQGFNPASITSILAGGGPQTSAALQSGDPGPYPRPADVSAPNTLAQTTNWRDSDENKALEAKTAGANTILQDYRYGRIS